jgi:hypothetical protein
VYVVPAVRPDTVIGLEALVPVIPPGLEVAVNVETAAPPVALAVNATVAVEVPVFVAVPIVGACGTVVAVTEPEALEEPLVPVVLVPVAVNV